MKPAMFMASFVILGPAALEAQTPKCENQRTTLEMRVCLSGEAEGS